MKKMLILALISLSIMSCATNKNPAQITPIRNVAFDFIPPASESPGSADLSIILVNPQFSPSLTEDPRVEPFASFSKSMANDFEEILTTRGYKIYGPFRSIDELVYSVKEEGDIILDVEIDLILKLDDVKAQRDESWEAILLGDKRLFLIGSVSIYGKLNMKAIEPMSGEKIWVKSIPIDPISFAIETTRPMTEEEIRVDPFPANDPGVFNPLSLQMEAIYEDSMSKAYIYLEPKELGQLKPQIDKIKARVRH